MLCLREMYLRNPNSLLPDLAPFFPSLRSVQNEYYASIHRFGCKMPEIDVRCGVKEYAIEFIRNVMSPPTTMKSFDEWITESDYPGSRKRYFCELRSKIDFLKRRHLVVESFIKAEGYEEPKNPRGILSYTDETKVVLGPICQAVDKAMFSLDYFVKGRDPKTWPGLLLDRLGENCVICTDFSSFEAHHRGLYADVVKFWFRHMTSKIVGSRHLLRLILAMVGTRNKIVFPCSKVEIDERLMSGALWTSSSNGLLNLMIMSFLVLRTKFPDCPARDLWRMREHFRGFVEGDDGICVAEAIPERLIESLGVRLKFEYHKDFSTAGFCSIYCDRSSLECVRDPKKILRSFFYIPIHLQKSRPGTVLSYLRAKALSYKYLSPN